MSYNFFYPLGQKYKRGVIQQVFSPKKENGNFPKWKVSWLGEFFTEQSIRTSNSIDTPLVSLTVENGVTPKTERYYREFLVTKDGDNYKAIKPGWFAYNPMNAHLGAIAPNHLGYTAAVSGYYNIFSVNEAETISAYTGLNLPHAREKPATSPENFRHLAGEGCQCKRETTYCEEHTKNV